MPPLNLADVTAYIEANIKTFHDARIARITGLRLARILKGKNPYLFKAKDTKTADEFVRSVLDAFLSSGEETIFGNFLEELAIFVNKKVYGGQKAGMKGIDLDFEKDATRYLVSIKSGPVWGNSEAVKRMIHNFNSAKKTLLTSGGHKGNIEFVNGCCYGIDDKPYKQRGYYKFCGQRFWKFISGNDVLYEELIVPLGRDATEWKGKVEEVYVAAYNRLLKEMGTSGIILDEGALDWQKIIQLTSKIKKNP